MSNFSRHLSTICHVFQHQDIFSKPYLLSQIIIKYSCPSPLKIGLDCSSSIDLIKLPSSSEITTKMQISSQQNSVKIQTQTYRLIFPMQQKPKQVISTPHRFCIDSDNYHKICHWFQDIDSTLCCV